MVYAFARKSRGHVTLDSVLGKGTTVSLCLPKDTSTDLQEPSLIDDHSFVGGHEQILFVEDDPLVRKHVAKQLAEFGYLVTIAPDGLAALQLLRDGTDVDLLFTDVVMPGGMNGPDLAAEARKMRPDLKVLYTSGYSENAIIHHGRMDAGVQLLAKPYRQIELARKIRELLDADSVQ